MWMQHRRLSYRRKDLLVEILLYYHAPIDHLIARINIGPQRGLIDFRW